MANAIRHLLDLAVRIQVHFFIMHPSLKIVAEVPVCDQLLHARGVGHFETGNFDGAFVRAIPVRTQQPLMLQVLSGRGIRHECH